MKPAAPNLTNVQRSVLDQEFPRFSDTEFERRAAQMAALLADNDLDHVIVYGAQWAGNGVGYFTGWPVTSEAAAVYSPAAPPSMFVQFYNHVPLADRIAEGVEVGWGGQSTIEAAIAEMEKRGKGAGRVGVIGPLSLGNVRKLDAWAEEVIDLNRAYFAMRLVKSDEEIEWMRIGAALSDLSVEALIDGVKPGLDERDLGDLVERAYQPWGGTNVIHFFGVTQMSAPDCCVPRQWPLNRRVQTGDVLFTEISTSFFDYGGQVLRTFAIGADPTPLYRDLYDTAEQAYNEIAAALKPGVSAAELVEASAAIERNGFTVYDDLIHGYGGGYLPPILGPKSRPAGPIPDIVLKPNMCLVVQPNVITDDQRAGVQMGECLRISETGWESLHDAPAGFRRVGG